MIQNPVLTGFHPDPSILRVGEDYYIATSTFEWWPAVAIHHSRDLVHWRLLTYAITHPSQLNLIGNPNSGGVWAPCLSYDNGTFYLVYSDMKSWHGQFDDVHNYLITAPDITGPWSDPIYLNSSGFDPSLFHDADGRKWLLNLLYDHRAGHDWFAGIIIQEYSPAKQSLVGQVVNIFRGTVLGQTEGPHLYKRDGYYYLITAEGGTSYDHAVTVARSKDLFGPYEVDPENPILTSAYAPTNPLQKAGHASLVETQTGEWYLAHLCGRPIMPQHRCSLGRETALQRCVWSNNGWLRLAHGGREPAVKVQSPNLPSHPFPRVPEKDDFDQAPIALHFNTLRDPAAESWFSLTERPGFLRLRGRESLSSLHRQSLVARRQQSFHCRAETAVEFEPVSFQQMAGLICFYDTENFYYLHVTHDERLGVCLNVAYSNDGKYGHGIDQPIALSGARLNRLAVEVHRDELQFYYISSSNKWTSIGPVLDASRLSDEYAGKLRFTGTFLGMCVQDLSGKGLPADFDYFIYQDPERS